MKHKTLGIVMRAASWVYVALWCVLLVCSVAEVFIAKAPEGAGGGEDILWPDWMIYAGIAYVSVFGIISAMLLPLSVGALCKSGGRRTVKVLSVIAAVVDNVFYIVFWRRIFYMFLINGIDLSLTLSVWIIVMFLCIVLLACSKVRDS